MSFDDAAQLEVDHRQVEGGFLVCLLDRNLVLDGHFAQRDRPKAGDSDRVPGDCAREESSDSVEQ